MGENDEQGSEDEEELPTVEQERVTAEEMDDWLQAMGWNHEHVLGLRDVQDFQLHLRTTNGHRPADVLWEVLEGKDVGVIGGLAWVDEVDLGEVVVHRMEE